MRRFVRLMAGAVAAASVAALTMAPSAMADPPSGKTVHNFDLSGIGADTTQSLFDQFSVDYNAGPGRRAQRLTAPPTPYLYSWDATNPTPPRRIGDSIKLHRGACAALPRPDRASAGVVAHDTQLNKSPTARSGPVRNKQDYVSASTTCARPATAPPPTRLTPNGGLAFITLAGAAITYAAQPGSAAPHNLSHLCSCSTSTPCKFTNWSQVGGKNAPIHAFIPQSGSGIRSSFLSAIGIPERRLRRGTCVSDGGHQEGPGRSAAAERGHQRRRLNKDKPDVIFPFSIGKYLAQVYHSAKCLRTTSASPRDVGRSRTTARPACRPRRRTPSAATTTARWCSTRSTTPRRPRRSRCRSPSASARLQQLRYSTQASPRLFDLPPSTSWCRSPRPRAA